MKLWEQFDRLVVFDTETTGFSPKKDKIIELGAVAAGPEGELGRMDALLSLPEGRTLPPYIVELTGITDAQLASEGVTGPKAAAEFRKLLEGAERPLLAAYNAQFDLNFLFHFLDSCGMTDLLRSCRFLDVLTVYRDRRDYPHKLCDAIQAYGLGEQAVNSHRAIDDAWAAFRILEAMAAELDDLTCYVDLFGVHPKYGVSGRKIHSITYIPQPFQREAPLYKKRKS